MTGTVGAYHKWGPFLPNLGGNTHSRSLKCAPFAPKHTSFEAMSSRLSPPSSTIDNMIALVKMSAVPPSERQDKWSKYRTRFHEFIVYTCTPSQDIVSTAVTSSALIETKRADWTRDFNLSKTALCICSNISQPLVSDQCFLGKFLTLRCLRRYCSCS